jgi:hypothetical protein
MLRALIGCTIDPLTEEEFLRPFVFLQANVRLNLPAKSKHTRQLVGCSVSIMQLQVYFTLFELLIPMSQ